MFTVCPKCTLTLAVTADDLRVGQGYVRCGRCANVFNALLTLSEEPTEAEAPPPAPVPPVRSSTPARSAPEPPAPAPASRTAAQAVDGPQTHLQTEQSLDGSIENESSRAEGTGTFETIILEGEGITQTEEFVPKESVDSELASLSRRLGVPAHELHAAPTPAAPPEQSEATAQAAMPESASLGFAPASAAVAGRRWPWLALAVLLGLGLLAQGLNHWRDALAETPAWNRPLTSFYAAIGHPLDPRWDLAAYDVRQQGATAEGTGSDVIHVRLSLANHAVRPQPTPMVRLTLLDRYGKRIATRDLAPTDYWPRGQVPHAFLGRDERIDSEVAVRDPGGDSSSFELDVCLRGRGVLRCAGDALAAASALATRAP